MTADLDREAREKELIERFRDAVFGIPAVIDRLSGGQQFNAYEYAGADDDIDDDDREYQVCIGPIGNRLAIFDVEGRSKADLIEVALKLAAHVSFTAALTRAHQAEAETETFVAHHAIAIRQRNEAEAEAKRLREALSTVYGIAGDADGDNAWGDLQRIQMLVSNTFAAALEGTDK